MHEISLIKLLTLKPYLSSSIKTRKRIRQISKHGYPLTDSLDSNLTQTPRPRHN